MKFLNNYVKKKEFGDNMLGTDALKKPRICVA